MFHRFSRAGLALGALCGGLALFSIAWLNLEDERLLDQIPKRQAQGRKLRLEHHMATGFHRAAWAGVLVGLAGVSSVWWWGRRESRVPSVGLGANDVQVDRGAAPTAVGAGMSHFRGRLPWRAVWVAGGLAMVVSGILRAPRLGHSFWSDEAYAARSYVWGVNESQADGSLQHQPVSWSRALFLNERSNNHVWCTVEARASLWAWRKLGGHPPEQFSEAAMRLPAYFWGLLTVGAMTVLGAMEAGRGGVIAGLLLAVHPWHVRFGAEMRGYSAMLLAITLGMIFLRMALRDGRWRWWLLSAAMNLWALLAFVGSVYVPLLAGGVAAGWLVRQRRFDCLARLVVANALAAVPFLWLYGPSIPQLGIYLEGAASSGVYQVNAGWFRAFGESLCLGQPWAIMADEWRHATWLNSASTAGWAVAAVAVVFALRVVLAVRWAPRFLLIPGLVMAAGALLIGQALVTGGPLLLWYLLPIVLGWVLLIGGAPELAERALRPGTRRLLRALALVGPAVCLAVWTGNSLAMAALPRQPMREAVLAAHEPAMGPWFVRLCTGFPSAMVETLDWPGAPLRPPPEGRLVGLTGTSELQMRLYDPTATLVRTVPELDELESRAAAEGKVVYVSVCGWDSSHVRNPGLMRRLEADAYEAITDLPGWEPMFSYRVLRKRAPTSDAPPPGN